MEGNQKFASGLNFYKLFWIFMVGSFLGVIIETVWCLVTQFKLESRTGVIFGPFNPVYGFGAVVITICLYYLMQKRDLWIFIAGALLGGVYEYLCSWIQETLVGTVSWEYSGMPFNLNGRTNLLYMLFWGVLAIFWLKHWYPAMSKWIERIPAKIGVPVTWILVVFMIFNMSISAIAVSRKTMRHDGGIPPRNKVEAKIDKYFSDRLLEKIYPNMQYVNQN